MNKSKQILAVDVGNTRTKIGFFAFESPDADRLPECLRFLAIPHGEEIPWESLAGWTSPEKSRVAIAGSHPSRMAELRNELQQHGWGAAWPLTDRSVIPLAIDVDEPEKVGIDRLLNAVAANVLRPADRAAIVIDTGTAATVDFLSADGRFCGGAILPGFALSAQALHAYTALLPSLTVRELANEPPLAVGRNTSDAIRSGVYWGHAGAEGSRPANLPGAIAPGSNVERRFRRPAFALAAADRRRRSVSGAGVSGRPADAVIGALRIGARGPPVFRGGADRLRCPPPSPPRCSLREAAEPWPRFAFAAIRRCWIVMRCSEPRMAVRWANKNSAASSSAGGDANSSKTSLSAALTIEPSKFTATAAIARRSGF